jgi:GntR family transcriptional regulator
MFQIDRFGRKPIYEQIIEQTEQLIASGVLKQGDQMPSVRALSQVLATNPNTLQKAYTELERRGITMSAPGNGRFITADARRIVAEGMDAVLHEVTLLSNRLCAAGVPAERTMDAVRTAYAKHAEANGGTHAQASVTAAQE